MTAYYNEFDPFAAAWLRESIRNGHIAPGDVDERDIRDIKPDEIRRYTQHHFFAGVGVWSLAHANLSARQAQERGLLTSGTYGPTPSTSSASYALQQQLASRLQAKTALFGSTLYKLTWKERVTPSGRSIPALRGSVRRTSGNDCIGWPTPMSRDHKDTAGMATEAVNPDGTRRHRTDTLPRKAHLAGPARLTATGRMLTGSDARTISGGQLSPRHSLWLMLGPLAIVWASCGEAVTRSTSRKRNTSSKV